VSTVAVVGAQWGDEGKGKVVDYFAVQADMVIRYQGGNNAGHTVVNDLGTFALHLLPAGIFYASVDNVLGPGTVIDPEALLHEMAALRASAGLSFSRLWISERAHVVMPYHRAIDAAEETQRRDKAQGTTRRGIGPTYADKAARAGIRIGDLLAPDYLAAWLPHVVAQKNALLAAAFDLPPFACDDLLARCLAWGEQLRDHVVDTLPIVAAALHADRAILLEGQLGIMRDLDWGHYPYVTSSSPSAGGACIGAGIPPSELDHVWGVAKAYTTSVGEGPFPTEQSNAAGERLRAVGEEYGASTGRPRRCGWFDAVAVRTAVALNGIDAIALTKIDILDEFERLPICVAYQVDGRRVELAPDTRALARAEPVYEELPGWRQPTGGITQLEALPPNAQRYLRRIQEVCGVPIGLIGTGQQRAAVISLDDPFDQPGRRHR